MSNFVIQNVLLKKYKGNGGDVFIPNGVTKIGSHAFYGCTSLTSVTIPDSVTSIGDYAFSDCTSLTSVTIPDSVTEIGDEVFSACDSLTAVTIPDSVTEIGDEVFSECLCLTSVTIPDSVMGIGDEVFSGCANLKELILGKRVYPCDESVSDEISFILEKIEEKKFSELPDNDLAHFFMWGYYKRTGDESALPYVGDFREELPPKEDLPPPEPEPQFDDIDSEEKFQALMESAMEEDNPSALPPLEKFSMYLTPPQVTHYLYLGVDKRAYHVSMLLWDYMKTDSYILEDYKATRNKKYIPYIKEHFEMFMNTAIEQNDINTVQTFTEIPEFFTSENIEPFMHTCLSKKKREILMILMDYQANQFGES